MKSPDISFHIGICDDDENDVKAIGDLTEKILDKEGIPYRLSAYGKGDALREQIETGNCPDLLLLDVMMPGQDGIELAALLRRGGYQGPIVFISINREMALRRYEVSAVRYLAKPMKEEQLREALLYGIEQARKERDLLLPVSGGKRKVSPKQIAYIETRKRGCRVVEDAATWDTGLRINELEEILSGHGFVRCHQSFLVNLSHIQVVRYPDLELKSGRRVPVSKHRIKEVRQAFFSYLKY